MARDTIRRPSDLISHSQNPGRQGWPPCEMAPAQVCQAVCRQQGRRPSGKGRVKSAFQLPGKKGGGEGNAEKRNRPSLSVGDTKHGSQRGPERGEGGCPGHRSSPHLRGGWGRNVHGAFLRRGQPERAIRVATGRGAPAAGSWRVKPSSAAGQGGAGPQRALRCPAFSASRSPPAQPLGCAFRASPGSETAPQVPCTGRAPCRAGHNVADHVRTPTRRIHSSRLGGGSGGLSYLSPAPGPAAPLCLLPPRSLQPPRSPPGTAERPRTAASKPVPKGRGGKREAGYRFAWPCISHAGSPYWASGTTLTQRAAAPGCPGATATRAPRPPSGEQFRLGKGWAREYLEEEDEEGRERPTEDAHDWREGQRLPRRQDQAQLSSARPFEHRDSREPEGGGQVSAGRC